MHRFDRAVQVTQEQPLFFKGLVTPDWSINGTPNGGYLMAIISNALLQLTENRSTPIVTANFVSRCLPGEAFIEVEKIAQSSQFERFEARLTQGGEERIRALATFAAEKDDAVENRYEASIPDIHRIEECFPVPEIPNYTLYSQMDLRMDPDCTGWVSGNLSEKSELKGWIRFKDEHRFDILSVLLIADSFPPAVLASHGMVAWVPTLEFSVNIRNIPQTGWLKAVFRTRFMNRGIFEEDGEVWDENGELVAISRQIAQFRKPKN
jgi:acyl-CoA thioesterase